MIAMADYATEDRVMTGEAVGVAVRPTGFLLRTVGGFIDLLVSVGVFVGLLELTLHVGGGLGSAGLRTALIIEIVVALVGLPVGVELASRGRSLGRLAVGARIVRADGGAAHARHAFVRALAGTVEIYLTLGGLAVLVSLLDPRARRLGDLLAGTYSQNERMPRAAPPPPEIPALLAGWARTADVAPLPAPLARRVASFIAQEQLMSFASRSRLADELTAEASAYVSPVPPVDAVLFLQGVAAVRRNREFAALAAERSRLEAIAPTLTHRPYGL